MTRPPSGPQALLPLLLWPLVWAHTKWATRPRQPRRGRNIPLGQIPDAIIIAIVIIWATSALR